MSRAAYPTALLVALAGVAVVTFIGATSAFNWISETFPAFIGAGILVATYRRFEFTPLSYTLAFVFAVILFVGGHYTYALVPMGEWMKDWFGFHRNHFDRLGHFMQGVMPAILIRERLLRATPLPRGPRLFFIVVGCCLAISAAYELFEWRYAVTFGGEHASDFLGSQGDPWDAQQDMAMALIGSIVAQLALGKWHDRQMGEEDPRSGVRRWGPVP